MQNRDSPQLHPTRGHEHGWFRRLVETVDARASPVLCLCLTYLPNEDS